MNKDNMLIHEKFEEISVQFPNNIAIIHNDKKITFNDLNKLANNVAHFLLEQDIKIGYKVGIVMDRSINMMACILGVLKIGATYIPLDPNYPKDRIEYCLHQSKSDLILYQDSCEQLLQNFSQKFNFKHIGNYTKANPNLNILSCEIPTYILYTSGSTGKPKGVLVNNKSVMNHMKWMEDEFNFSIKDIFLQKTSSSFDASVWEMFSPLLCGASMVISSTDPDEIISLIKKYEISIVQFVPTILKLLVEMERLQDLKSLRLLFSGGEALFNDLVQDIHYKLPIPIVNLYGPTEATIDSTFYICTPNKETDYQSVPLGRAINNVKISVVDQNINEVLPGEIGELIISGANLAEGYYDDLQLTKEHFIINPNTGERTYLTGDLVKKLDDNTVTFYGRKDNQVKLRGLRIELGEIEECLRKHPKINDSFVSIATENGISWIVAYIRTQETNSELKNELKDFLSKLLPNYMIPNYFVTLNRFPNLENGKIDKKALANLDFKNNESTKVDSHDIEEIKEITRCWSEILGINNIGLDDSFFSLGGHSLQSIQLTFKLSQAFSISLPSNFILSNNTVRKQYNYMQNYNTEDKTSNNEECNEVNLVSPLSYGQLGILFLEEEGNKSNYNIGYKLKFDANYDINKIISGIKNIEVKHPILISQIEEDLEGIYIQKYNELLKEENYKIYTNVEDKETIISAEVNTKFDLANGGFKYVILESPEEIELILTFHHIIADGISIQNFLNELNYQLANNYSDEKYRQNTAFFDFSKEINVEKKMVFWKDYLKNHPTTSRFSSTMMKSEIQTVEGSRVKKVLSKNLRNKIKNVANTQEITEFSLYFAAASIVLSRFNGQNNNCIGVTTMNRHTKEEFNAIGNFVNVAPYIVQTEKDMKLIDIASNIQNDHIKISENDDVPIELIINSVIKSRDLNYRPLFQVMFSYNRYNNNNKDTVFAVSQINQNTTKCDLSFIVDYSEDEVSLVLEYSTNLFNEKTVSRIAQEWILQLDSLLDFNDISTLEESNAPKRKSNIVSNGSIDEELLESVSEIWKNVLKLKAVDYNRNFFDLGGHSLLAMKLIHKINNEFNIELAASTIFEYPTINQFTFNLENNLSNHDDGVIHIHKKDSNNKVWFIHPAGGQIWCYNSIVQNLKSDYDIYGIENSPISLDPLVYENNLLYLAEIYAEKIMATTPKGKIWLVGYSFGGTLSFEIANILREKGYNLGSLILIDCHITKNETISKDKLIYSFASKFTNGNNEVIDSDKLFNDSGNLEYLLELGQQGGHLHDDASITDVEKGLKIWIANNQAIANHNINSKYYDDVLFIKATLGEADATSGWDKHLKGQLSVFEVESDHFSIYNNINSEIIAQEIKRKVNKSTSYKELNDV